MNPTTTLWLSLGAAALAVLYGIFTVRWVLAQSPGNARMQEIAGAVQEGAKAYMNRQYSTIAIAGVVLFLILGLAKIGLVTSKGLLKWWRFALVGAFVISAIVTPSIDPITQTLVAVPMVVLYFVGILFARLVENTPIIPRA